MLLLFPFASARAARLGPSTLPRAGRAALSGTGSRRRRRPPLPPPVLGEAPRVARSRGAPQRARSSLWKKQRLSRSRVSQRPPPAQRESARRELCRTRRSSGRGDGGGEAPERKPVFSAPARAGLSRLRLLDDGIEGEEPRVSVCEVRVHFTQLQSRLCGAQALHGH